MRIRVVFIFFLSFFVSCQDLSLLHEDVAYLDKKADAVQEWLEDMKVRAAFMSEIVKAIQNEDYVTDIVTNYDENTLEAISYTIFFANSEPLEILLKGPDGVDGLPGTDGLPGADGKDGDDGKDGTDGSDGRPGAPGKDGEDGKDGAPGKDGEDGQDGADGKAGMDGKDGNTPYISVGLIDGEYYWMSDGEWILDNEGAPVPVKQDCSPRLKAEGDIWYISFDEGNSWTVIDPFTYMFSGVEDVEQEADAVFLVLSDGTRIRIPYKSAVSFTLSKEGCVDAVPGAIYNITYVYSGIKDAHVTLLANDAMGSCSVTQVQEGERGNITYALSENQEVNRQKLVVILNYKGGTISKTLTFKEAGTFEVKAVEPISENGGECLVSVTSDVYTRLFVEVTSGGDWLRFASTTPEGSVYEAQANMSLESRVAEITVTAMSAYLSTLFTKKIYIVQFGQGGKSGYREYIGNWTMTGKERVSGKTFSRTVRILQNDDIQDSYLIYGLSPDCGNKLPAFAKYDSNTGEMKLQLHQECISGTDYGLYAVSMSGNDVSMMQSSITYTFMLDRNEMEADMDYDSSFMFMSDSQEIPEADKVFYYDVNLTREGLTRTYQEGEVVMLNEAADGYLPLNLIILGDGYQEKDMKEGGKFERSARSTMDNFFSVEPFASFKNRFDVYMLPYYSVDEGTDVSSTGTIKDTYFSSVCAGGSNTLVTCDYDKVLSVVRNIGLTEANHALYRTVVILLVNTAEQSGSCWYIKGGRTDDTCIGDGIKSMAIAMLAANTMGAGSLVRHEAGGHGFGRLADEYNWGGNADAAKKSSLSDQQNNYGFYWNVSSVTGNSSPWAHFVGLPGYEDVGYYEGAWGCSTGLYRPTESSIMLNNQGKFNAPSREIIYKRIILQSEGAGSYSFEDFLEYDKKNL